MKFNVDVVRIRENSIQLNGWAIGKTPDAKIAFDVEDEARHSLEHKYVPTRRDDVSQIYFGRVMDREFGFDIQFPYVRGKDYYLVIRGENRRIRVKYNEDLIKKRSSVAHKRIQKIRDLMNMETVHVCLDFWKENGLKALLLKSKHKLQGIDNDYDYGEWYSLTRPSNEELERQRQERFDYMPKFSIVIPVYKTPERYLKEMLDSILAQTYAKWEVCVADGSPRGESVERVLRRYAEKDRRFKYVILGENKGISGNTNAAIDMADGDFIVLADHDDMMTPDALYECAKKINENPECDVLYSDEDKLDMDGGALFDPHFKPDFNIDLLRSVNYICHLFVVSHELAAEVGGFCHEFDGAQDYDFIFRCVEHAGAEKIHHIPKILYHWRCHEDSTSENPESKLYAFDAGQRAVQAHYDRIGVKVEVSKGEFLGLYRTKFLRDYDPLISIIIPNKDHIDDLKRCIDSIEAKSTYTNYEYIIVENNSEEKETFAYYEQLEAVNPKVHVVYYKGHFNYSAINNFGVQYAKGEYFLLLNNDTEIINDDCLEELLGYCTREDVGAVGARLYYEDDTIQHAGVVIGFGGIAGHCFVQQKRGFTGYCHRIICAQDYSAVTAACMMVKREAFEKVGGLSEELQVAFNDIDFCMKLRQAGYLIVYNPYAELYHYESKSRGLEDTPEKVARFNQEIATFEKRWPDILKNGDPFYNPNLTLDSQDFSLKRL